MSATRKEDIHAPRTRTQANVQPAASIIADDDDDVNARAEAAYLSHHRGSQEVLLPDSEAQEGRVLAGELPVEAVKHEPARQAVHEALHPHPLQPQPQQQRQQEQRQQEQQQQ